MTVFNDFLEIFYPPKCIVCNEPIMDEGYCRYCNGKIKIITEETCFNCGIDKKHCECDRNIYHFDGITAPYYNETYAQHAVYNFKFRHRFSCVKTFAADMAQRAEQMFGKENIDIICFVPANKRTLRERGFNQSELFAEEISRIMNIRLDKTVLCKKENTAVQHNLGSVADRYENIRGSYYTEHRVDDLNILLVDDIKTTGASLDECARQLKFAGAERVYCVTALISRLKFKKETNT